ncbi:MAG TPA: 30S ribosomal protein S19 [Candidatus Nanoarchaeia archaeon]|nr:30S ribosomal protein S19 [Candidatus Nanoarchaeia archaeon]
MAKIFTYRGKTDEELSKLDLQSLSSLLNARARRNIKRGFTEQEKKLLEKITAAKEGKYKKQIKTHCREMPILPIMFGMKIGVHNGKEFVPVTVTSEMVGLKLGDFVWNMKDVKHSGPGIGATRGSKFMSVK